MSVHFDSFELDYLHPLSFHSSAEQVREQLQRDDADVEADADSTALHSFDSTLLDSPSSPFLHSRDLSRLVSPSPAPSSTSSSCGSSGDSLYDSDELSSVPSAGPYIDDYLMHNTHSDKHRTDFLLHSSAAAPNQQPLQPLHYHCDDVYGVYEQPDEFGIEMEMDVDMDEEEEEEETATPALAAVPPAEIVQATVADPSFVPNPAFAKLNCNHTVTTTASLQSPHTPNAASPIEQQLQPQLPVLPPSAPQPAVALSPTPDTASVNSTPTAIKPKRKYTKRAKPAQTNETAAEVAPTAATTASDVQPLDSAHSQPTVIHQAEAAAPQSASPHLSACAELSSPSVTSTAVAVAAAVDERSAIQLTAVVKRGRSVSCEDADDNASIVSAHSQQSTQSAPLLHATASSIIDHDSTGSQSPPELVVSVDSPSASPTSSPASSPRSIASSTTATSITTGTITTVTTAAATCVVRPSMSFSLASLPTLPPPGKPGRKRKNALPPAATASTSADSTDGSSRADHSDGSVDSVAADGTTLTVEGKRMVRLQRNRASAQLSRERKKRYMGELEERMKALMDVNCALESQLSSLAVENAQLKKRLGDDTAITPAVAVKKRVKLSRGDSKRSAAGATVVNGTGRTALLMFGIFISFALFYNLVGIEFHSDRDNQLLVPSAATRSSSPTYTPPFAGRLLQSLRESNSLLAEDVSVTVKKEPLAIEPPPSPSQQPQQQQSLALVAVDSSADNRALVVKDEHSEVEPNSTERGEQHKLYEPFAPYRTHNVTGAANMTHTAAGDSSRPQYVLCADATAIQPLIVESASGEKRRADMDSSDDNTLPAASRTAKRLRKSLGLPTAAPVSPSALSFSSAAAVVGTSQPTAPAKLALGLDDQLLLWLPSNQLQLPTQPHTGTQHPHSNNNHTATRTPAAEEAEMVQVRCQVQSLSYVSRA